MERYSKRQGGGPAMTPVAQESLAPALAPFGRSSTLPSEAYTSELVFRWELDRFFDRTWVCIGRTEDLQTPGDQRAVGLESALLTRDEDGGCTPSTTCAATAGTSSSREVVAPTRSSSAALTTHRRTGSTGPSQALRGSASSRASIETVTRSCPSASSSGTAGSSRTPAGTLPRSGSTSATSES